MILGTGSFELIFEEEEHLSPLFSRQLVGEEVLTEDLIFGEEVVLIVAGNLRIARGYHRRRLSKARRNTRNHSRGSSPFGRMYCMPSWLNTWMISR
jgi:hypothetical protein